MERRVVNPRAGPRRGERIDGKDRTRSHQPRDQFNGQPGREGLRLLNMAADFTR
jgi:hypothetical protein